MIAIVETSHGFCIVKWVGLSGLSVKIHSYCGCGYDSSRGVMQVPDRAIDQGTTGIGVKLLSCCTVCKAKIK
jgi:hypothetical protein